MLWGFPAAAATFLHSITVSNLARSKFIATVIVLDWSKVAIDWAAKVKGKHIIGSVSETNIPS